MCGSCCAAYPAVAHSELPLGRLPLGASPLMAANVGPCAGSSWWCWLLQCACATHRMPGHLTGVHGDLRGSGLAWPPGTELALGVVELGRCRLCGVLIYPPITTACAERAQGCLWTGSRPALPHVKMLLAYHPNGACHNTPKYSPDQCVGLQCRRLTDSGDTASDEA